MLENTFCHIPGFGVKTEQHLWQAGLLSWGSISEHTLPVISAGKRRSAQKYCAESTRHLASGNARYFNDLLPSNQSWRMFREFCHSTAYIDIETTGLSGDTDCITTIALYDGKSIFHYVRGRNMQDFARDIENYKLIVTYNGKTFDIPFIRKHLRAPMRQAHIDLRYVLAAQGYTGGLKQCEKAFGIERDTLEGVDGFFAVLLWYDFLENNNQHALETLLAYNITDVINLAVLMPIMYNANIRKTPFAATHIMPQHKPPKIPFKPHVETINRLRQNCGW